MYNVYHKTYSSFKIIEIFIIGIGGVGSTLLRQIYRQQPILKKKNIILHVYGIANSKILFINMKGINLKHWLNHFNLEQKSFNFIDLISLGKNYHFCNPVIIDCTSSELVSNQYINFLLNGFHVITSNKQANTASWKTYQQLRQIAKQLNRKFLYETNVGAGLPVIENLQNLFNAGDKLIKFSGILSGSLSFIFGKLDNGMSLSEATKIAKKMNFTEPNPRDDLSGMDVARKLLILAREAGYKIELSDISVDSILPHDFINIESTEEFMNRLPELDHSISKLVSNTHQVGKVLRFVANIENCGICKVQIKAIDKHNPLFNVKNGENALAFYSRYYNPIPLVLRGYGAGNEVTAAGIFADLLRVI